MPLNEPQTYMYVSQMLDHDIINSFKFKLGIRACYEVSKFLQNKDGEHRQSLY